MCDCHLLRVRWVGGLSVIADTFRNSTQQTNSSATRRDGALYDRSQDTFTYQNSRSLRKPDCDWGRPTPGFSEGELDRCRHEFREFVRHGLDPKDTERICWFDLEMLTLTLLHRSKNKVFFDHD